VSYEAVRRDRAQVARDDKGAEIEDEEPDLWRGVRSTESGGACSKVNAYGTYEVPMDEPAPVDAIR
jgi:hypothetical protein